MEPRLIPRIEDLPYISSPPVQFTYYSEATFNLGTYEWNDSPTSLIPNRRVLKNTLYYIRSITLSANIEEADFTSCLNVIPTFQMYKKGTQNSILFREPIYMVKYMENFDYRMTWLTQMDNDQLLAGFKGTLNQNFNLIGTSPITLTAIVSAQEITDHDFIELFKRKYPQVA